jgi:ligand-binding SRPBCC domain-containing protein
MSAQPFVLERRQLVPGDLATVFAFFKDPHKLAEITPRWLNFRVTSATDAEVRRGTRMRYRIAWLGFPMRWESLVAEYEENARFADEMVAGPYRSWYHVHTFRAVAQGVEIADRVTYRLPFGPLGRMAHAILVRRQLHGIFDYRTRRIAKILGTVAGAGAPH